MSARNPIANIAQAMLERTEPAVLRWNRLEGRPRSRDFRRALSAEVRDALWMLSRQWQLGEFEGEDAGSPVTARLNVRASPLTHYRPALDAEVLLDTAEPLEPLVERMPIAIDAGTQAIALDIRLAVGRRWLVMLADDTDLAGYRGAYIRDFAVDPPDLATRNDGMLSAHWRASQLFAAAAGRCLDGGKLLTHLKSHAASDGIAGVLPAHRLALDKLGPQLIAWYARVFDQPGESDSWRPERMEYGFAVDAAGRPDGARFVADEYHSGKVQWHSFDVAIAAPPPPDDEEGGDAESSVTPILGKTFTTLPTAVQFDGMPNSRWWRFEDGRVNFGDIKPERVDIGRLLLIEFGLVFSNDWFLIPIETSVGSISDVRGLIVTNNFGERTWIEPTGRGQDHGWRGSRLFGMAPALLDGPQDIDAGLMVPNAAVAIMDGPPIEEVLLARDELSNLVWGVERTVTLPDGSARLGAEAASEMLTYHQRWFEPAAPLEWQASLRYEIMNSVPEHWIPFVPAHIPGQQRAIRLQRGVMLRALDGDPLGPQKVRPRTSLLRTGIDQSQGYFLFEEEVPRAGARVFKAFRRTRARGGRVITWLGARKQTGRGESSSGLAFDQLRPVEGP
jgi:hypothetical protein